MAGLGPRDSLRIEAALNLYGQEITETTSPIAAGLTWCIGLALCIVVCSSFMKIGKRRREQGGFLGAEKILAELKTGPATKRVGLTTVGRPARTHAIIFDMDGKEVGEVTSGVPSPSLNNKNVAIGYVPSVRESHSIRACQLC
jgi:aminomethyltransferase